jgi:hypothetical protein
MTTRTDANRTAEGRYNSKKRAIKPVSFNKEKPDDVERLRKLEQIPDFSNWVKSMIDAL